jgi:hypothetical protein
VISATHRAGEHPVLARDPSGEDERNAGLSLVEEVGDEGGDPSEDGEAGAGLEDKHGNDLLKEETDDNGWPRYLTPVLRGEVEAGLGEQETDD